MTAPKKNFDAEAARVAAEYETALAEVAASEQSHEIEIRRLAGQVVLSEITVEQARTKRAALDADLAERHAHLDVLRDALPELERRRAEEADAQRKAMIRQSGDKLAKAILARYSAAKNLAKAMREVENAGAELLRHRALVDEAVALHLERLGGDPFEWPRGADEEWSASEEVVALITAGPIQPLADAERGAAELERTRAIQEDEILTWAEQQPTTHRLAQIPERLRSHPRIVAAEKERDERIAAQKAARTWKREENDEKQATMVEA